MDPIAVSAIVVVPARDEEERLAGCLEALANQTVPPESFETILVADACGDATEAVARETAARLGLVLSIIPGPGAGAGAARRAGMDAAADRLLALGRADGLIACTDASSRPEPGWLASQLGHRSDVEHFPIVEWDVRSWAERRRYTASAFTLEQLSAAKGAIQIGVVIPTKECAATIERVLRDTVAPVADAGLLDDVVVIDADSGDATAELATGAGARVLQQDALLSDFGPALGKGDALWRAVSATTCDIVCFLDGDTENPSPDHLVGLIGPLLTDPGVQLVKGAFDRPLRAGGMSMPHEGGRVTELMARPLLNRHEPRLAGFAQPLAGEFAARRELLQAIPFPVGYGVEIAILIDAVRRVGLDALAECHLGSRQNRHQPLRALGQMAYAVLAAVENRIPGRSTVAGARFLQPWENGTIVHVAVTERPPLASLRHVGSQV